MLLYIHGFASSGFGNKAQQLRAESARRCVKFASPSLPVAPDLAYNTLQQWIECADVSGLVGSSLGGFYAAKLGAQFNLPTVLINPSTRPSSTLKRAVNVQLQSFHDQAGFSFTQRHLDILTELESKPFQIKHALLLLQEGDEVLDAQLTQQDLAGAQCVLEPGGNHSFLGFERHFDRVYRHLGFEP